jgi:hypothetical protein
MAPPSECPARNTGVSFGMPLASSADTVREMAPAMLTGSTTLRATLRASPPKAIESARHVSVCVIERYAGLAKGQETNHACIEFVPRVLRSLCAPLLHGVERFAHALGSCGVLHCLDRSTEFTASTPAHAHVVGASTESILQGACTRAGGIH